MSNEQSMPWFERFAKSVQPWIFKSRYPKLKVQLDSTTSELFKELSANPLVICPNHSRHEDGELMFLLSIMLKQPVKFLAAKEMFRSYLGLGGIVLRQLGCYEIKRGADNSDAVLTVQRRLASESSKLVIFPEGEITYNNDLVEALEPGAAAIGLDAMQLLRREGRDDKVYIMPLAISYQFDDVQRVCSDLIVALEKKFGVDSRTENLFLRSKRICQIYLNSPVKNESVNREMSVDELVSAIVRNDLEKLATQLEVRLPEESVLHQIHHLQSKIFAMRHHASFGSRRQYEKLYRKTLDLVRLRAFKENVFEENSSLHSLADLLCNLNYLVCRKQFKASQTAVVSAGRLIELHPFDDAFAHEREKTIEAVTNLVSDSLQKRLSELRMSENVRATA